jgi:hypothetical protein
MGGGAGARIADVEAVKLKLSLEITSIKGNIIFAQGRVSGPKFNGSAYLHLNLINASRAQASFNAYNSHGSLSGTGSAPYRVSGTVSYFTGGNPSIRGTGKYAKTKSLGMKMSGSMNRRTLQIAVNLQGRISD